MHIRSTLIASFITLASQHYVKVMDFKMCGVFLKAVFVVLWIDIELYLLAKLFERIL